MRARSLVTTLGLAAGAIAAGAYWLRHTGSLREHVDVYFADGSMVSFVPGTPEGDKLLPIARRVLAAARG
jgi:hypothetical protein